MLNETNPLDITNVLPNNVAKGQLCQCGCGKRANKGRRYIKNHHCRVMYSDEHRKKISMSLKGHVISKETREKISATLTGRVLSDLHKSHIGECQRGKPGHPHSAETKLKLGVASKRNWQNQEFKEKMCRAALKQTKPEKMLEHLLDKHFAGLYKYTGAGKTAELLFGRIPDFMHTSKHKIIEVFGEYWHGSKFTGRCRNDEEKQRKQIFESRGWDVLIVWEADLINNVSLVIKAVSEFTSR